ncbi:MAG: toll/interleukin-1 receptor domain-containing protein [Tissierellaceae bacterium]|nr:toll/interleukin-1 receptor domain-containing protein [Tissierellaceae bacterium]
MTEKNNLVRERQESKKLKEIEYTRPDEDKPYIFISYASKDWEEVLENIAYELHTKKGLRIYYDRAFDGSNKRWIEQMREALETAYCKGILVFISEAYITSYATLIEILYSRTEAVRAWGDGETDIPLFEVWLDGEKPSVLKDRFKKDTKLARETIKMEEYEWQVYNNVIEEIASDNENEFQKTAIKLKGKGKDKIMKFNVAVAFSEMLNGQAIPLADFDYFLTSTEDTIRDTCGDGVFDESYIKKEIKVPVIPEVKEEEKMTSEAKVIPKPNKKEIAPEVKKQDTEIISKAAEITIGEVRQRFAKDEEFNNRIGEIRKNGLPYGAKSYMDYAMAAVLKGCNDISEDFQLNYYINSIANPEIKKDPSKIGATFTWSSNARKAKGFKGSGKLDQKINDYFASLPESTSIKELIEKFEKDDRNEFMTRKNKFAIIGLEKLIEAWDDKLGGKTI